MTDEYVTRKEHEEFAKRIDDENVRQNHRIASLEKNVDEIHKISISVEKMAFSLESMSKELSKQGERLDEIEKEPAEKWNKAVWVVISVLITAAVTYFLTRVGL